MDWIINHGNPQLPSISGSAFTSAIVDPDASINGTLVVAVPFNVYAAHDCQLRVF
jgi:hypothetical protein